MYRKYFLLNYLYRRIGTLKQVHTAAYLVCLST